jgi:3-dehydroquinate dehydratase-2
LFKVKVIHGVNLNLLGIRDPAVYGTDTLEEINEKLKTRGKELDIELEIVQSNIEGEIVEEIHRAIDTADAIIINPAAYTHYSFAIRDAIASVRLPTIEVHLSNIFAREEFRQKSAVAPVAAGLICGFGTESYLAALSIAKQLIAGGR